MQFRSSSTSMHDTTKEEKPKADFLNSAVFDLFFFIQRVTTSTCENPSSTTIDSLLYFLLKFFPKTKSQYNQPRKEPVPGHFASHTRSQPSSSNKIQCRSLWINQTYSSPWPLAVARHASPSISPIVSLTQWNSHDFTFAAARRVSLRATKGLINTLAPTLGSPRLNCFACSFPWIFVWISRRFLFSDRDGQDPHAGVRTRSRRNGFLVVCEGRGGLVLERTGICLGERNFLHEYQAWR